MGVIKDIHDVTGVVKKASTRVGQVWGCILVPLWCTAPFVARSDADCRVSESSRELGRVVARSAELSTKKWGGDTSRQTSQPWQAGLWFIVVSSKMKVRGKHR